MLNTLLCLSQRPLISLWQRELQIKRHLIAATRHQVVHVSVQIRGGEIKFVALALSLNANQHGSLLMCPQSGGTANKYWKRQLNKDLQHHNTNLPCSLVSDAQQLISGC